MTDSETELIQKFNQWKYGLARKGTKVNTVYLQNQDNGWRTPM